MDMTKDAIDRLVSLGAGQVNCLVTGEHDPLIVLPIGMKAEDASRFFKPMRIKQTVLLATPQSFIDYVRRFSVESSMIFALVTDDTGHFMAVLDYHTLNTSPDWCQHRASYNVEPTTEWKRWLVADRKKMSQLEFSEWLEENQDLVVAPKGAELLEFVMELEGKSSVRFNSGVRLHSGKNALNYDEDVELKGGGSTRAGSMELPRALEGSIAPFHGIPKQSVPARLKYRIEGRQLSLWFETVAAHAIIRRALNDVCVLIREKTELPLMMGELA